MKRVLLFGGAFVTGLAAALLAAAAMVVLPGWLQRESWQAQRPAEVVPTAVPAAGEEENAPVPPPARPLAGRGMTRVSDGGGPGGCRGLAGHSAQKTERMTRRRAVLPRAALTA